jgi:hypothetical protein
LAVVNIELPAMIRTLEILAVEASGVEGHPTVRAGIAESKGMSLAIAADNQGNFQQRGLVELIAMYAVSGQGPVPETGEHQRVGSLALRKVEFGHGEKLLILDC